MPVISKITGAPFRFWCQKILPAVYDDSLSYYELLCKVVDYLNKVMEDDINVVNLVNELEEYMNNYFDNLDVQQEINNKLDSMVTDGTLMSIIAPYLDPQIEELDNKYTAFAGATTELVQTIGEEVNDKLDNYDSNIQEQNSRLTTLEGRMDEFTALADGSTTGDAELADIRVGALGEPYPTAGDAVRDQINVLRNGLTESQNITFITTQTVPSGLQRRYYTGNVGEVIGYESSTNYLSITAYISTANYSELKKALFVIITPPANYCCRITEVDSDNVITRMKGQINSTNYPDWVAKPVIMDVQPDRRYMVTVGRFNGDASSYQTVEFLNSIGFKLLYYRSTIGEEVSDIRDGGNGIQYSTAGDAVRGQFTELVNTLTETTNKTWLGTDTYTTGWRAGYFDGTIGEPFTSDGNQRYMRATKAVSVVNYPDFENAVMFSVTPPQGYGIRVLESDITTGNITRIFGQINTETYPEYASKTLVIDAQPLTKTYAICLGRFDDYIGQTMSQDQTFVDQIVLKFYTIKSARKYKPRTGDFEWFTVTVDRPLPFNDEAVATTTEDIECVLRLPATYSTAGNPVPLVLMCHGAHGYIASSTGTWYNDNWKALCDALLSAGFALFDVNVLPTSLGTDVCGRCYGSPLSLNNAKKAYDYITENYNVSKKIFVHGTSMGGTLANVFTQTYGNIVIAQSSFAGRDISLYIEQIRRGTLEDPSTFALAYGYTTYQDLLDDKFSHIAPAPSLTYKKYNGSGVMVLPPNRDDNFSGWLTYFGEIENYSENDEIPDAIAVRSIPYKSWNSWDDNEYRTKAELVLKKAYDFYGGCEYNCVVYETYDHTQMSYGQVEDMRDQLIAWYKKFL